MKSFLETPVMDVCMAAVFVATKVECCYRAPHDIVHCFHFLLRCIRKQAGKPPPVSVIAYSLVSLLNNEALANWINRLFTAEIMLLRAVSFHVQPQTPTAAMLSYFKVLGWEQNRELVQAAMNYLNDAFGSGACIAFQPCVVACAVIDLAVSRINQPEVKLPEKNELVLPWFTLFDVNQSELDQCKQLILASYNIQVDTLLPITKEELDFFASQLKQVESSFHRRSSDHSYKRSRSRSQSRSRSKTRHIYRN